MIKGRWWEDGTKNVQSVKLVKEGEELGDEIAVLLLDYDCNAYKRFGITDACQEPPVKDRRHVKHLRQNCASATSRPPVRDRWNSSFKAIAGGKVRGIEFGSTCERCGKHIGVAIVRKRIEKPAP